VEKENTIGYDCFSLIETQSKRRALASCAPSRSHTLPLRNGVAAELCVRPRIIRMKIAITFLLAVTLPVLACVDLEGAECKGNKRVVGQCFSFHGRLACYNGNPTARIWRIGTHRILGIHDDENPIVPTNISRFVNFDNQIYADFLVCPFDEEKSGRMQIVCVESATNVVIEHYDETTKSKSTYHLR